MWAGSRPLTTTIGANITQRMDNRPGLAGQGDGLNVNADISKSFPLPAEWHARSDLRTRISFQNSHEQDYVLDPLVFDQRSRLTDNGRRAVTFTTDTDVAENLTSSFVISRAISFDSNINRQFTQKPS